MLIHINTLSTPFWFLLGFWLVLTFSVMVFSVAVGAEHHAFGSDLGDRLGVHPILYKLVHLAVGWVMPVDVMEV